jgi:shikimate dehydrogenase
MADSILVGLIGFGIGASLTPAMHEREGAALGIPYVYRRIDLDTLGLTAAALPELLTAAQRLGFDGLNITYPCKQAVLALLDELTPEAQAIGAVNTVVLRGGRRVGHNTDAYGFAAGLRHGLGDAKRDRVLQLGAGGAGAAVAHALLGEGTHELMIFDTEADRAAALAARTAAQFLDRDVRALTSLPASLEGYDGLVNTTPVGMTKLPGLPLPAALLRKEVWVAEIVYFPLETALLRAARMAGCRTLDGGEMAVFQAVRAFELFSGVRPHADRMRAHFRSLL